jgi:signal transduction histidine kinase
MALRSLAARLVLGAAVWCALLLSAGGYGLSALFGDVVEHNFDVRLGVLIDGIVAGSELSPEGRIELRLQLGEPRFDQPFSGWYWQINDRTALVRRSSSLWVNTLDVTWPGEDGVAVTELNGPAGEELRMLARTITLPGRDVPFIYAVAGDRSEITLQKQRFDRLLAISLGVLFLGVLTGILIQVRFGLKPLRRIRQGLSAIRSGSRRRLEGSYPTEIQPLAVELNALLDHNEALIERARTHVGNLAHGLKTPLAVLANEAHRTDSPLGQLVDRQVLLMRRQVDHHLARARAAATGSIIGARSEVAPVLADLQRTLLRIYVQRAIAIDTACPPELTFRGARQDLEEMLGNLMDNACKWATAKVVVEAARADGRIAVTVADDGPGLPADRRAEVLQRGRRLDETVPGSGLGLAIVVDLAALYGGTLELDGAGLGGLLVRLNLPAAE